MDFIKEDKDGVILFVKVIPNSKKNKIGDIYNNRLKLYISAPPVDNKANKEIINFLRKLLKVSKSDITITSGEKSHNKNIKIQNISKNKILLKLKI